MRLLVVGDMHGDKSLFEEKEKAGWLEAVEEDDNLIVAGDWGYLFCDTEKEHEFLQFLADEIPFRILWVDGNHENFDVLNQYPVEEWCGGKVHVVGRGKNDGPKVIHLMRGQVFEIKGKKIFTFGGGYSSDKADRKAKDKLWEKEHHKPRKTWWKEEMPSKEEMQVAIENLKKHNNKVDYIITHTAPAETLEHLGLKHSEEMELNTHLDTIRDKVDYKHWWFGHLHMDEEYFRNQTAVYEEIRDMETNETIGKMVKIDENYRF